MHPVLVDAGALIALLDSSDATHERAVSALASIREPLVTVWPALTEAMYLLRDTRRGPETLIDMISDAAVGLATVDIQEWPRIKALMQQYRDLPMDFADAVIVRVAEREGWHRILTFDVHFRVYRLPRKARFRVVA